MEPEVKYRLLDLCCKAGGCSVGYQRAGFEVVGVDIEHQPSYPFEFIQADAVEYVREHGHEYDIIHASPPCQSYSWAAGKMRNLGVEYPDILEPIREALIASGKPYVIENVVGAPLINPIVLCGTQFEGLKVFRHRLFESNMPLVAPPKCSHKGIKIGFGPEDFSSVAGHGGDGSGRLERWREAMAIDWMSKKELTQAIPPQYTHYIGKQAMEYLLKQEKPTMESQVICGDSIEVLRTLPRKSVHAFMNSFAYFGQRNYGVGEGEHGSEETPEEYIQTIVSVMAEVWEVLTDSGTAWLNLGDSRAAERSGHRVTKNPQHETGMNFGINIAEVYPDAYSSHRDAQKIGYKHKDLMGIPWRVAFALMAAEWVLRSAVIWRKENSMPSSAQDRPTDSYEYLFLFAKSNKPTFWTHPYRFGTTKKPQGEYLWRDMMTGEIVPAPRKEDAAAFKAATFEVDGKPKKRYRRENLWVAHDYWYDLYGSSEPSSPDTPARMARAVGKHKNSNGAPGQVAQGLAAPRLNVEMSQAELAKYMRRNMRDVWSIPTAKLKESHFAAYPPKLVEKALRATCPPHVCSKCGVPFTRQLQLMGYAEHGGKRKHADTPGAEKSATSMSNTGKTPVYDHVAWKPCCDCGAPAIPGIVLDATCGSGTTGLVATGMGLRYIMIDKNPEYVELAKRRVTEGFSREDKERLGLVEAKPKRVKPTLTLSDGRVIPLNQNHVKAIKALLPGIEGDKAAPKKTKKQLKAEMEAENRQFTMDEMIERMEMIERGEYGNHIR